MRVVAGGDPYQQRECAFDLWQHATIFCNGELIKYCTFADTEQGMVIYFPHRAGNILCDGRHLITASKLGQVEIYDNRYLEQ